MPELPAGATENWIFTQDEVDLQRVRKQSETKDVHWSPSMERYQEVAYNLGMSISMSVLCEPIVGF